MVVGLWPTEQIETPLL
uniref:Uncharacterized protein n=1 Tax=Arundo donax TaxID=35708 RepID=A0A0A9G7F5_ARUDO